MLAHRSPARPPLALVVTVLASTLALAAVSAVVTGCGREDHSRVGGALLPPVITTGGDMRDSVIAGASSEEDFQFARTQGTSGLSSLLLVANTAGMRARTLVHFATPGIDTTAFRHARLDLSVVGDSTLAGTPPLELHEVVQPWSEGLRGDQTFPGFETPSLAAGVFIPARGDTAPVVRFEGAGLDTLVSRWITTDPARQHLNTGLLVQFADQDTGRVDFHSRDSGLSAVERRPLLTVNYVRNAGAADSTLDSLRLVTDRDVFVVDRPAGSQSVADFPGRLTIASGVPARILLRFDMTAFDSSAIHRALLQLSVDSTASTTDSIQVAVNAVSDSVWSGENTHTTSTGNATGTLTVENGVPTLSFEITTIARSWALGPGENHGLEVHATDEVDDIRWMRIFDSTAPDSLRPRLSITSSPLPGAAR